MNGNNADLVASEKDFKYLSKPEFEAFLGHPENIEAIEKAPVSVNNSAYRKFDRFWPDKINPFDEPETPLEDAPPGPQGERFVCNRYPGYGIGLGNKIIKFKNGVYITSDEKEIEAIVEDRYFNLFIFADNPELRELKPRKR